MTRIEVPVVGTLIGFAEDGEDLDVARARLVLQAETQVNMNSEIRFHLDMAKEKPIES